MDVFILFAHVRTCFKHNSIAIMRFFNSSLKIVQRRTLTPFIGIASIHRHIPDGPVERRYHRNITGVTARLARTVHRPDPEVVGGAVFKAGDSV